MTRGQRAPLARWLGLGLLLSACHPAPPGPPPTLTAQPDAGGVTFVLSGPGVRRGEQARVTLLTPAGALRYAGRADRGGQLRVRAAYLRAGLTPYVVEYAGRRRAGQFRRLPGPPVTPLTLKVGARAVRVTAPRPPALVLHPLDAQGNVSALPVDVLIRRPDGTSLRRRVPVEHLTAWTLLPPGRVTGLMRVVATTGDAAGEVGEVDLLPGPVRQAAVSPGDSGAYRDLRDRLGNPVTDDEALSLTGRAGEWNVEVPLSPAGGRARSPVTPPSGARLQAEDLR
ncbi:hypothetical protein [Deinococcus kurensis]|uniref:hypothetical protein n=1 Tax=Deinococcus kurensis TaxID=2662757 RepID=UPI0012D2F38E|nr:hypothetical protein [Deinococcus kurensis]